MKTTIIPSFKSKVAQVATTVDMPTTSARFDFFCDQVAAHLCNDPSFIEGLSRQVNLKLQNPENIKSFAKSVNVQLKIQQLLEDQESQSSPFAPIFIADLKPDEVPTEVFAELDSLARITDISESIRLD